MTARVFRRGSPPARLRPPAEPGRAARAPRDASRTRFPRPLSSRAGGFAFAVAFTLAGCAAPEDAARIAARGEVAGQAVVTTVDSSLAAELLASGMRREAELEAHGLADRLPDAETLRVLAERLSPDAAALLYAEALARDPRNRRAQVVFVAELEAVRRGESLDLEGHPVLFVPGWRYRTEPGTGADFARQRALLERHGIEHRLLETDEDGTVEANAEVVAEALRGLRGPPVILVSASKAGAEVLEALDRLRREVGAPGVLAWINVGGTLNGSPLADWGLRWPVSLGTRIYGWKRGHGVESVRSMRRVDRVGRLAVPADLLVVNFIGIPLSGHMGDDFGYPRILPLGPNDGLALLPDLVLPSGYTLFQMGLDHYFRDPDLDRKTLALARTVLHLSRDPREAGPDG
jgi:hypothetical protein